MSEASPVILDIEGPVAFITLNRPEVLNAIDVALAIALGDAVDRAVAHPVRCIVLRGAGRVFCAGGDISSFDGSVPYQAVAERTMSTFHPVIWKIATLPLPTVAMVHGVVAGAGIGLMLACDFAVAATDTRFTLAYPKIGATIDAGASWFLARALGVRKAKELAMLGEMFAADIAMDLGLVNQTAACATLREDTDALARRLASGPTAAYKTIKKLNDGAHERDLAAQLDLECAGFTAIAASADFAEGLAAFRAKRPPVFSGK